MTHDQILLDKDRVIEIINQLFIGTDQRDWSRVQQCLTEHVLFDMSSMSGEPRATVPAHQIVDGWASGLKDLTALHHQVGNYLVTITGDTATAFC